MIIYIIKSIVIVNVQSVYSVKHMDAKKTMKQDNLVLNNARKPHAIISYWYNLTYNSITFA